MPSASRGALRPPARPLRVLDPRRRVPHPGPRRAGRRARDAGRLAHRPRVDGGRGAALQGGEAEPGSSRSIGCEVYVADDRRAQTKGYAHLTLLAADNAGYANLIKLSSLGYLEGYYYKPRVDWELLERHADGRDRALRLPLGPRLQGARGEPPGRRARPSSTGSRRCSGATTSTSSSRTRTSRCRRGSCRSSPSSPRAAGLPTVATGDVHYLRHEDARAHEALLCIQSGDSLKNPNHWKFDTDHFFFKTPGRDGRRLPRPRRRAPAHARGRRALQRRDRARQDPAAAVPRRPTAATRSTTSSSSARTACRSATARSRPS